jgi:methionyl-tRNA formyltransferase
VRLVFLGTPAFAVPSLRKLVEAGHDVGLVVTQPDRPAGRGNKLTAPPVAEAAKELGLPLFQTSSLRGPDVEARLREAQPDAMALAAFAALVPQNILDLSAGGVLNVHPSLLPEWRGAAPIQSALAAGQPETGVSIIRLVKAMDAGPIASQRPFVVAPEDDYLTLEPKLANLGAEMLVEVVGRLAAGSATFREQDHEAATYCRKIEREDARLDWSRPADELWHQVRAYRGWPQAFTSWSGKLLKVLRATPLSASSEAGVAQPGPEFVVGTGSGSLRLDEVVLEGKRPQSGAELLRGYPALVGATLG